MPARQSGSPWQQCIRVISAFLLSGLKFENRHYLPVNDVLKIGV